MAMNLRGPFLMVKHAAPNMIARKYGKIINISSGTAYKGMPLMLHYVTSKGGILAFTRALSRELGVHSICVNTLAPGLIRTDGIHANSRPSRSDTGDTVRTAGRSFTRPSCAGRRIGERGERHPHCAEHLKLGAACQPPWPGGRRLERVIFTRPERLADTAEVSQQTD
jgi:NAD(P)-dependent dehydrogenase (short-subunit alcohol dehydrogenase family)